MGEEMQTGTEADDEAICPNCGTRIPLADSSAAEGITEMKCPNCGAPFPPPPAGT